MLLLVAVLGLVHWRLLLEGGPVAVLAMAAFTGLLLVVVLAALSWSSSVRAVPLYRWLTTRAPSHRVLARALDALHEFRTHRDAVFHAVGLSRCSVSWLVGHRVRCGGHRTGAELSDPPHAFSCHFSGWWPTRCR